MHIRQLQVACDPVQDRLVLRVNTPANEEIRVYLTRRFLREIWPHLARMLSGHLQAAPLPARPDEADDGANDGAGDDGSNALPPQPSFDAPFTEDNPSYPLGAMPLLASEATLEPAGPDLARLTLREARERSLNLNLNHELLQALCAMLRATSAQAGWDLALDYAATGQPALPIPAVAHSGLLH